jgi:hypothetical protein
MENSHTAAGDADKNLTKNNQFIVRPEWIRLPKEGTTCPYSGLTRSFMADLLRRNLVRSKSLRRPGAGRGVRLICYESLMEYIRRSQGGEV